MATYNPTPLHPTAMGNAYTNAPALHPNIFVGTLQLLFWIFVHPTAWRNYIAQIDPERDPNFSLLNLQRAAWGKPELHRILVLYLLLPPLLSGLGSTFSFIFIDTVFLENYILGTLVNMALSVGLCLSAGLLVSVAGGLSLSLLMFALPFADTPLMTLMVCLLGGVACNLAYTQEDSVVTVAWQGVLLGGLATALLGIAFGVLGFVARLWEVSNITIFCLIPTAIFLVAVIFESFRHLLGQPSKGAAAMFGLWVLVLVGLIYAIANIETELASQIAFFTPLFAVGLFISLLVGVAWAARANVRAGVYSGLIVSLLCGLFIFTTFQILDIEPSEDGGSLITYESSVLDLPPGEAGTASIIWNIIVYNWPVAYLVLLGSFAAVYALSKETFRTPLLQTMGASLASAFVGFPLAASVSPDGVYWFILNLAAITFFVWRPILTYPVLMLWHQFLRMSDQTPPTGENPHWLSRHAAFWDEHQSLPWWGLSQHVQHVLQQAPQEGQQALAYLKTSRQARTVKE